MARERKSNAGRPSKFTPETIQKLEFAFSLGCTDTEACCHADVSLTALYDYQNRCPEFLDRKNILKDKVVLKARTIVNKDLDEGDSATAKWIIEKKDGKALSKQEISGSKDAPLTIISNIPSKKD